MNVGCGWSLGSWLIGREKYLGIASVQFILAILYRAKVPYLSVANYLSPRGGAE